MQIAVIANNEQWHELAINEPGIEWIRSNSISELPATIDAYFILTNLSIPTIAFIKKPVFIDSVIHTLHELNALPNVVRINGWPGFLSKQHWEVAGLINEAATAILVAIKKKFTLVSDEPGFVSARVISMIVNEAYFALQQNVSTKQEIDIAMKLGTNYPHGPFEWASIIGIKNISDLLKKLSDLDNRYMPAALLQKEATL